MTDQLNITQDYPGTNQLKLFEWKDIAGWQPQIAADTYPDASGSGHPYYLHEHIISHLKKQYGQDHWRIDSIGPTGIAVLADNGWEFYANSALVRTPDREDHWHAVIPDGKHPSKEVTSRSWAMAEEASASTAGRTVRQCSADKDCPDKSRWADQAPAHKTNQTNPAGQV